MLSAAHIGVNLKILKNVEAFCSTKTVFNITALTVASRQDGVWANCLQLIPNP
jgi:hypothetical protein